MTSNSSSNTRRSNTGLPRTSPSMASTDTPDQALRDLKLNGVASSIKDPASQTTTPAGGASDDASIASSSRPRRHRRGGRKKKSHMAAVEETRLPWSERMDEGMSGLENGGVGQINRDGEKARPNAGDVSDNVSIASSSQPRRHKRGGRRKKNHMASVDEAETRIPWSERVGRLGEELSGRVEERAGPADGEKGSRQENTEKAGPMEGGRKPTKEKTERTPDTGVRAFNIKRAEGGRPFEISIDRGDDAEGKGKKSASESEEQGEKGEKKKPVSIRLDLNLEIEIFLKAAIKGDVTITFLE